MNTSANIPSALRTLSFVIFSLLAAAPAARSGPSSPLNPVIARNMQHKPGSVVVLDIPSGRLLAQWNIQMAARRVVAPGSAVKPFVLAELLRTGRIRPEQRLACRRPLYISGRRMDCSHPATITDLDAVDAIAYSCNSWFAAAATNFSGRELAEVYRRAGFTSVTGLDHQEVSGAVAVADTQAQLQLQTLGEWGIEVTPLELASAYRKLALNKSQTSADSLHTVFDGLERSVQYGMAHAAQPIGITAAGKTGTAAGLRSPQTHGFFVGYAPADKPEIVVMIYLENARGADAAALGAPIFTAYAQTRPSK